MADLDLKIKITSEDGGVLRDLRTLVQAINKLDDAANNANDSLRELSDAGLDDVRKSADKADDSLQSIPLTLGGFAALGAGVFGVADALLEAENASNKLAAQLGLTTEKAEVFADIGNDIYRGAWGDSLEQVNDVLAQTVRGLASIGDTSRESIKTATENALTLGSVFGDTEKQLQASITLQKQFGISSQESFDLIAGGFQRGLDTSGDFLDSILEYSNQFSQGGASASQFFSVLDSGLSSGVLGTDKAADMFKEFQVRILDGSATTSDALKQIGLSSDTITKQINSGQMTVADAFQLVQEKLRGVDSQAVQMQAGVGLLGTQFEDLGINAALSVDSASVAMSDLTGSMDLANQVNQSTTVAMTEAWRTFVGTITDSPVWDNLLQAATYAISNITSFLNELPNYATIAFAEIGKAFAIIPSAFEVGLGAVKALFTSAFQFLTEQAASFLRTLSSGISGIAEYIPALGGLTSGLDNIASGLDSIGNVAEASNKTFNDALAANQAGIEDWKNSILAGAKNADVLGDNINANIPALQRMSTETDSVTKSLVKTEPAAKETAKSIRAVKTEADKAKESLSRLMSGLAFEEATAGMSDLQRKTYEYTELLRDAGELSESQINAASQEYKERLKIVDAINEQADEQARLLENSQSLIEDLGREIDLLGIVDEAERERAAILQGVAPEYKNRVSDLLDQKAAIEEQNRVLKEQEKVWNELAAVAGNFFQQLLRGGGSAKQAFQGLGASLSGMAQETIANRQTDAKGNIINASGLDAFSAVEALGKAGDLFGADLSASLGGFAESIDGFADQFGGMGNVIGGVGAAVSLLSGDIEGGLSSIGGMLGSLTPLGPLGGMIGSTLGGMLGGALSGGETRSGATYISDVTGTRLTEAPSGGEIAGDEVRRAIEQNRANTNAILEALGSTARIESVMGSLESSTEGKGGVAFGGTFVGGGTFGEVGTDRTQGGKRAEFEMMGDFTPEEAIAAFELDLQQGIVQALQAAADTPEWLQTMLAGVDAESLSNEQVQGLLQNINAIASAKEALEGLGGSADLFSAEMIEASGGVEKLAAKTVDFYSKFSEESDQGFADIAKAVNNTLQQIARDAGTELPKTRAEFLNVVQGLDLATESGRTAYNELLAVSDAFLMVRQATEQAQAALNDLATIAIEPDKRASKAWSDLNDQLTDLGVGALPATRAGLQAYLDTLDETNAEQYDAIQLLEENKNAIDAYYSEQNKVQTEFQTTQLSMQRSFAQEQVSITRDTVDAQMKEAQSLLDFVRDLTFGADSTLTGEEQIARAEQTFLQALQSGNEQSILETAKTFRELSKQQLGESQAFADTDRFIRESVTGIAQETLGRGAVESVLGSGAVAAIPDSQNVSNRIAELEQQLLQQQQAALEAQNITNRLLAQMQSDANRNAQQQVAATTATGSQTALAVENAAIARGFN